MHSIRRSCQTALAAPIRCSLLVNGTKRAFSRSTACQRGALPQFLESSSRDLATVLRRVNSKVLLPEHLTPEQQKLVYKIENKPRLEAEPIEITLGEVTLPLEHIDRRTDIPRRWSTLKSVLDNSKTPEDWENVVRMLEGFHNAGIHLKPQWMQSVVSALNKNAMHHLVFKALRRAGKTGLRLNDPGVTHQWLEGLHEKAAASEWDAGETTKALGFAEQTVELMENDEHLGKVDPGKGDLRADPYVIAVPLELAAARALKATDGQDRDGKVAKYASRLMNALHQDEYSTRILPKKLGRLSKQPVYKDGYERNQVFGQFKRELWFTIPFWNALRTANKVLGANMPMAEAAQKTEKELREALAKGQRIVEQDEFAKDNGRTDAAIKRCEQLQ